MHVHKRKVAPIVGGVTAAAAVVGAIGPATQVAVAAPDAHTGAQSPLGLAQEGTFESCSAFFGEGKGVVGFEVTDVNGSDGVAHAVPTDVAVVLVLGNEAGDTLPCTPEEIDQDQWESWTGMTFGSGAPELPASPVRYTYPTVEQGVWIERGDFGVVTSVGFRVAGYPGGHTLISPVDVKPLPDLWWSEPDSLDPRVLALLTEQVSPEASAAYAAAYAAVGDCDPQADLGDDLAAAIEYLDEDLLGYEDSGLDACTVGWLSDEASAGLALIEMAGYVESIQLQAPEAEAPASTTSTTAPAQTGATGAQPVTAAPTYTG